MKCQTPGHDGIKATWLVLEDNVILVVCIQCANVAIKMNSPVRRIDAKGSRQ